MASIENKWGGGEGTRDARRGKGQQGGARTVIATVQ